MSEYSPQIPPEESVAQGAEDYLKQLAEESQDSDPDELAYREFERAAEQQVSRIFTEQGIGLDRVRGEDFATKYDNINTQDYATHALLRVANSTALAIQTGYDNRVDRAVTDARRDERAIDAIAAASVGEDISDALRPALLAAIQQCLGSERFDRLMQVIDQEGRLVKEMDRESAQNIQIEQAQSYKERAEDVLRSHVGDSYMNHDDWGHFVIKLSTASRAARIGMRREEGSLLLREMGKLDAMADRIGIKPEDLADIYDELGMVDL